MPSFTELEKSALHAIFSETPDLAASLERQLQNATVTARENTGGGFYTDVSVSADAPTVAGPKMLGDTTFARVQGLSYGLGFLLFMKDGRMNLLEGYAIGPENTTPIDLETVPFTIATTPFDA